MGASGGNFFGAGRRERRSAKLGNKQHERVIEHSALLEVAKLDVIALDELEEEDALESTSERAKTSPLPRRKKRA